MKSISGPTQFVILGGSGDLSKRKLLPALLDLYSKGALPEKFRIVGLARTPRSHDEYRQFVSDAIAAHQHEHTDSDIKDFCSHIDYVSGSFDDGQAYADLKATTDEYKASIGQCTNVLFYLAVPPKYYENIFQNLHNQGFAEPCDPVNGWTRVLVEKPFGHDRASAQALDAKLSSLFQEEQIYRIDHYLAKEAIQNILSFRFANNILQAPWNRSGVESIRIRMHETVDVANRGSFYDVIGALRDVGQNHLLQLLAVITMDEPHAFTAAAIRDKRADILETLIPITADTVTTSYRRAQYEGYRQTDGVADDSETETAFWVKTSLNDPSWRGVPIFIETAKAMSQQDVSVTIRFKDVATGPFETKSCLTSGNEVRLEIEPSQSMHVTLNAKAPGLGYQLESRTLSFTCNKDDSGINNAYERVLMDCIRGDQTLFVTGREVVAQWSFINSIFDNLDQTQLETYQKDSTKPFQEHE